MLTNSYGFANKPLGKGNKFSRTCLRHAGSLRDLLYRQKWGCYFNTHKVNFRT